MREDEKPLKSKVFPKLTIILKQNHWHHHLDIASFSSSPNVETESSSSSVLSQYTLYNNHNNFLSEKKKKARRKNCKIATKDVIFNSSLPYW